LTPQRWDSANWSPPRTWGRSRGSLSPRRFQWEINGPLHCLLDLCSFGFDGCLRQVPLSKVSELLPINESHHLLLQQIEASTNSGTAGWVDLARGDHDNPRGGLRGTIDRVLVTGIQTLPDLELRRRSRVAATLGLAPVIVPRLANTRN
jgi:hypothetical protein